MVRKAINSKKPAQNEAHIAAAKAIHKKYAPKVHEQAKKIRAAMAKLMELEDEMSGEPTLQNVDCCIMAAYASFDTFSGDVDQGDTDGVSFEAALGMIEDVIRDSAPKKDEDGYDSSGDEDDEGEGEEGEEEEEVVEIEDDE